jgi:hypothetical protein
MWNYGTFEGYPAGYDDSRGFVLFVEKDGWREISHTEVKWNARPMTKSAFDVRFPDLPPLPKDVI